MENSVPLSNSNEILKEKISPLDKTINESKYY
jgi:hypothetical protein